MLYLGFVLLLSGALSPLIKSQTKESNCGRPNGIPAIGRIVGGYDVGYYKYPWFAALTIDNEVSCGGTLIGPKTVLTAAHCFKPYFRNVIEGQIKLEDVYTIKLGMYNKCQSEPNQKEFRPVKVQLHEKYYEEMPYFDIALITLDRDAKEYTPVCLPQVAAQSETRGKECIIQGFGRLDYDNETFPCTLQEARLLIYPDERCKEMLNFTENNGSALQHAFCAGYLEGKVDSCLGDSGGPLLFLDKNGRYTQLGLTSFGFGCAQKDLLGIYTDVSHFVKWIVEASARSNHTVAGPQTISNPESVTYNFLEEIFPTTKNPATFLLRPPRRRRRRPWKRKKRPYIALLRSTSDVMNNSQNRIMNKGKLNLKIIN